MSRQQIMAIFWGGQVASLPPKQTVVETMIWPEHTSQPPKRRVLSCAVLKILLKGTSPKLQGCLRLFVCFDLFDLDALCRSLDHSILSRHDIYTQIVTIPARELAALQVNRAIMAGDAESQAGESN